jgi:hypothetical protein
MRACFMRAFALKARNTERNPEGLSTTTTPGLTSAVTLRLTVLHCISGQGAAGWGHGYCCVCHQCKQGYP